MIPRSLTVLFTVKTNVIFVLLYRVLLFPHLHVFLNEEMLCIIYIHSIICKQYSLLNKLNITNAVCYSDCYRHDNTETLPDSVLSLMLFE